MRMINKSLQCFYNVELVHLKFSYKCMDIKVVYLVNYNLKLGQMLGMYLNKYILNSRRQIY
jgi:hypothetical protein